MVYYPVVLDGDTVGYVWASVDPEESAAGYVAVMSALESDQQIDMAILWDDRLKVSFRSGLSSTESLEYWKKNSDDSSGGGIPEASRLQESSSLDELKQTVNPDYQAPRSSVEFAGEPINTVAQVKQDWEWQRWDDFAPVTIGKTYRPRTDQPVRYLPVHLGDELIGYLWASVTDDAADFQCLLPPIVTGNRAHGWWIDEMTRLQESGVSPLQALRSRVGAPEDPKGGRIDADAEECIAPSLDALKEIARRSST